MSEHLKHMTCTTCGARRAWPDGFPSRIYSVCWSCSWAKHVSDEHPKTWRQQRAERRRAVRAVKANYRRRQPRDDMPTPNPKETT